MDEYEDNRVESIEALDWLKKRYVKELNPNITSVSFYQSNSQVWVKIVWTSQTVMGLKQTDEVINLDFIADPYDTSLDIAPDGESHYEKSTFSPEVAIETNAEVFFSDKVTLLNATPLFDN